MKLKLKNIGAGDKMTAYYIDRMENVSATATVATVPTPPQT